MVGWIIVGILGLGIVGFLIEVKNAPEIDFDEDREYERELEEMKKNTKNK